MKDEIVIAEACNGQVRIHAACTTALCEQARVLHHCLATSAAALGRVMTVTAIMASDLKNDEEKITSVVNGHGPIGTVLAQAKGNGEVRGFVSDPSIYLVREDGHLAVGQAVGTNGTLTVIKDLGLKEPFSGIVRLRSGEIGEDYAYYFAISEQTPSVVSVGVLVEPEGNISAAGGMIIQLLPGAGEEAIEKCEQVAKELLPMTTLIHEGKTLEESIRRYFGDAEILDHRDVKWNCPCNKEHYRDALSTISLKDLDEMIAEGKPIEIVCEYCGTKYTFSSDELKEIRSIACGK